MGAIVCPKCHQRFNDKALKCPICGWVNVEAEREKEERAELSQRIQENSVNFVISTCQTIDGYKAKKQLGLVFGETYYKGGFFSRLTANIDNQFDMLKIRDTEMSGAGGMVDKARSYAIEKMKREALSKGANAIVGVDAESSFGGEIIHVMVYGTAVFLEKE